MTPLMLGPLPFAFRRFPERPNCPCCGDSLLAAEASEFVAHGRIRHAWLCDSCGHGFVTTVQVSPLGRADAD